MTREILDLVHTYILCMYLCGLYKAINYGFLLFLIRISTVCTKEKIIFSV